jgi:excisionase family DNA binding protein
MTSAFPQTVALPSIDSAALLLTAEQACRVLNVSRPTLYRLIGDGTLRSLRVRGRRMFRRADLERFVARPSRQTREASTGP